MADVVVEFRIDSAAIAEILAGPSGPVAQALAVVAQQIVNIAKSLTPVDTGRLRSSITWQMGRAGDVLFAEVGTNVEYAPHVEFGTRWMAAQPYLVPALLRVVSPTTNDF